MRHSLLFSLLCLLLVSISTLSAIEPLPLNSEPSNLHWIGSGKPMPEGEIAFEREFSLDQAPLSAKLKLASMHGCDIIINGESLKLKDSGKGPEAIETKLLNAGDNKIRVVAKPGAQNHELLLSLLVVNKNGVRRRLETNASWQVVHSKNAKPEAAIEIWAYGKGPHGDVFKSLRPSVTPAEEITVPTGFKVELLHALDDDEGSWVAMCTDHKGRLIASDAGGGLVRITPAKLGEDAAKTKVESIPLELGHANGLLWAFDSLYVMVCEEGVYGHGSGVYRARDTNNDDVLDSVELLRKIHGSGDHGPHALILSPDGQSITVVCGNSTRMTEIQHHQVPPIWKDDLTLPKLVGHGFMLGTGGPAGYIARMSPDGKEWTLAAAGFRNQYDAAYNRHGELFTYDADMEWDLGMPWYRPTRVNHVVDGAENGWRSVSGKWPEYYADSLPPVINVGRGSPTGVAFGYGAKFPAKYQEALFIADWTYGKLYAVHLKENGASYTARMETFLEGRGVKPTDIAVSSFDGALYFCGGSRRSNSALYRVTYVAGESTSPATSEANPSAKALRELRHKLENHYHASDEASLQLALDQLSHDDRFIRFAARTLLEFRPVEQWKTRALALTHPRALVQTAMTLARLEQKDVRDALYQRLHDLEISKLDNETKLDAIRAWQLVAIRLGDPEGDLRTKLLEKLHRAIPATDDRFNVEVAQLLVRWKSPLAAKIIFPLFERAGSQEEQIAYAASLRLVNDHWPAGTREKFLRWFLLEKFHKAGNLAKFITDIRKDAVASLSPAEQATFQELLAAAPEARPEPPLASRLFVKNWETNEIFAEAEPLLSTKRELTRGKTLFRETGCLACHLFKGEGGVTGPDLTLAANKFKAREIIEHITEPSKVISEQYATWVAETNDGEVITGRLVNNDADKVQLQPNLYKPAELREIPRKAIAELKTSAVSLMPLGLLNTCHPEEVADLLAYIQSGLKPTISFQGQRALIAHWKFDDEKGEAIDSVGEHHGTIQGAVTHEGKIGKALLFDRAKSNQVRIPHSPDFEISTFTVSAWVRLTKDPTFSGVLGTRLGGEGTFDMKVNTDKVHGDIGDGSHWIETKVNFYKNDVGSNGQGGDLELNRWYLITYVIDHEKQECRLYLDADHKKTIPFRGEPKLMRAGQTMTIGNTGANEHMDGVIDDVRIWNYALSDEEVKELSR